ncbi:hypothetical protein LTR84_011947 [Exophiala bonariae]|uniref:amidase n=1 Tax=Exophiala bonariae TaxID=1690606 RepID=A0AAV9MRJ8_9EURO|nr:hypothetical protein LTR84_011947 [Exophiala bonariae]
MSVPDYQAVAGEKRAQAAAKIPHEWRLSDEVLSQVSMTSPISVLGIPRTSGLLSTTELDITENYTAIEIRQALASRRFTTVQVTSAFSKRAAIAQQLTNCITETFFDQALERARFLDNYLAEHGELFGPLHGIPISVKDSFNLPGIPSTLGFITFNKRDFPDQNSPLIEILLSLGAVIYCKTNVPQTLMTADSDNNLFGRTLNPHKLTLTPGGSSGGEGALIAMRGSLIGVGTDIGGSIRIPGFCCGTYSFKPSVGRVPYGGQTSPSRKTAPGVKASAGPLAMSVADIDLFLSSVLGAGPWDYDSTAICVPWRPVTFTRPLTLGFILEDPDNPVSPPIARALKTAVALLRDAGHQVADLKSFPSFNEATAVCWDFFRTDPRNTSLGHIEAGGEPQVTSVALALQKSFGTGSGGKQITMDDYFDLNAARGALKHAWFRIFLDNKFDAIILPAYVTPAPPHDTYRTPAYTSLLNLLDYPGTTIPFLKVDKATDARDPRVPFCALPFLPNSLILESSDQLEQTDDPETYHGVPCHIQLMSRTQHDEELMEVARIVAGVLNSGASSASSGNDLAQKSVSAKLA